MSGNFGSKRIALSGDWYEAVDPDSIPFQKVCSLCLKYAIKKRKCEKRSARGEVRNAVHEASERNAVRKREGR